MCRRPIAIWPDCPETFLAEAGWREIDGRWHVPLDRLSEGGLAKVGESADENGAVTPRYQFMPPTPDTPHTLDQAVRAELWRQHGTHETVEVIEPAWTERQLDAIRQQQRHSQEPLDFILAAKRAETRFTGVSQCGGCHQWPDGWSTERVSTGLAATRARNEKRLRDAKEAAAAAKVEEAKRNAEVSK